MKISFLLQNAYGIGGTIRSTFNVAGALAARHDVEIVSVIRSGEKPRLALHPRVRVVNLIDQRTDKGIDLDDPLLRQDSEYVPPAEAKGAHFSALTDRRVAAHLAATDADVVIATRPGLVMYLAEFGRDRRYLRIGQEHRIYGTHEPAIRAYQDASIPHLDAHTTVSEADAVTHREALPGITTKIVCIPNGCPPSEVEPADPTTKLVVAAGRLIPVKRYDLLIGAWAQVAAAHPDWRLRLYGRGPEHAKLRARIDKLGLNESITLMGAHSPIEPEWAKGSIAAVTSREESFGMTIVEAMGCGVPVVATDCPHGPGEIISDGEDGLLVPVGDTDAIAKGLLTLIEDDDLRRTMGEAARLSARRYAPERIADAYLALIDDLGGPRPAAAPAADPALRLPLKRRLRRLAGRLHRALRPRPSTSPPPAKKVLKDVVVRKPLRPVASCRVDAAGDIRVLVDPTGVSGHTLSLTVTRRKEGKPLTVPLDPPADGTGPWTAVLRRTELRLAEGRWDLHVVRAEDKARRRVVAHLPEGRRLLALDPLPGSPFTWWIPYSTVDGYLAVRAWYREAHAEARTVRVRDDAFTVEGTVHGAAELGSGATVFGRPRGEGGTEVTADVEVLTPTTFRFTLPHERLAPRPATWDLFLRPAASADPIRIGRLTGDIVDRNKTDVYPVVSGIRPYFTVTSDLAVTAE
ncbi:glycosyltransferase family 4 protein [Streptomyces sp. NPDC049585]|uniref:glycosyltransferase family 4 protein n=1 Tax=Streptomyces sp. NPDC049585 TaxID=3155154 RepID=UPI003419FE1D